MPRTISCAYAVTALDQRVAPHCAITINGAQITSVASAGGEQVEPLLVLPALVNAHDHRRSVRTSSVGAGNKPLESWLLHLAVIPSVDPYLAAAVALGNGRFSVTNVDDGRAISPGAPADLLLLDWGALDDDRLSDAIDPLDLLFSCARAKHIRELIVGGRTVMKEGVVLGVDLPTARAEVITRMRTGMRDSATRAAALPALERVVAPHFEPSCC